MGSGTWLSQTGLNRISRRRFVNNAAILGFAAAAAGVVGCSSSNNTAKPAATSGSTGGATSGTPGGGATAAGTAAARSSGTASATTGPAPQEGSYVALSGASTGFVTIDVRQDLFPSVESAIMLACSHLIQYSDANKGTIVPDVAAAMPEQPDNQTYVFALRPDVTWVNKPPANGRSLTVDDVIWNLQRQLDQMDATGKPAKDFYRYNSIFKFVDKISAVDASHLKVTLKQSYAPWLDAMCHQGNSILLKEVVEKIDADFNKPDPALIIGTGPYTYSAFEPGKQFIAVRNPDYFGKKAGMPIQFLDEIRWIFLGLDPNPLRAALTQKQFDSWGGSGSPFTSDYVKNLLSSISGSKEFDNPNPNANLTWAYSTVNPPFNNKSLAQAVNLVIDRHKTLDLYYQGEGRINATVPWPYVDWALGPADFEQLPGFRTDKTQDIKDARNLWNAGGGPAVGPIQLHIAEGANNTDVPEWFAAMLNQGLGVNQFKVDFTPLQSLVPLVNSANFDNIGSGWTGWESADPRARFADDVTPGGAWNFSKYSNDEVTGLVNSALQEFDLKKAQALVKQAQLKIAADGDGGKWQMMGTVIKNVDQGYLHLDRAFIGYDGYYLARAWIDQKDPSFAGKPKA